MSQLFASEVAKVLEPQLQHQSFQWIPRTDLLYDGLVGSPLLQHHSSKASILWRSAFFIVQLSHPYMTTGKTICISICIKTKSFNTNIFILQQEQRITLSRDLIWGRNWIAHKMALYNLEYMSLPNQLLKKLFLTSFTFPMHNKWFSDTALFLAGISSNAWQSVPVFLENRLMNRHFKHSQFIF